MNLKKGDILTFPDLAPCNNGSFVPALYTPKQNAMQKLSNKLRKKDPDSKLVEIPIIIFNRQ